MCANEVEKDVLPLSPFRRRPKADTAETMLGELILVELYSEGFDLQNNPLPLGDATVTRANTYLASQECGLSQQLRELIGEILETLTPLGTTR